MPCINEYIDSSLTNFLLLSVTQLIPTCFTVCLQFYDLMNIFELNGLPSDENPYLFNGDFVDRGSFSLEVILTLFAFKCMSPSGKPTKFLFSRSFLFGIINTLCNTGLMNQKNGGLNNFYFFIICDLSSG